MCALLCLPSEILVHTQSVNFNCAKSQFLSEGFLVGYLHGISVGHTEDSRSTQMRGRLLSNPVAARVPKQPKSRNLKHSKSRNPKQPDNLKHSQKLQQLYLQFSQVIRDPHEDDDVTEIRLM